MPTEPIPERTQQRQLVILKLLALASVAAMMVLLAISYRNLVDYVAQNDEIRHAHVVVRELEEVMSLVTDAEAGQRGFLISNDTMFLESYNGSKASLAIHMADLQQLLEPDIQMKAGLPVLRSRIDHRMKFMADRISDQRNGLVPIGQPDSALFRRGEEMMDQLRSTHANLMDHYSAILRRQEQAGEELEWSGPGMVAVYAGAALLCIGLLLLWMFRSLERAQNAERLALITAAELDQEARTREMAERSLKRVLDSSQNGIMAFRAVRDEKGAIADLECTRTNEAAEQIFRRSASELLGRSILRIHPENQQTPVFPRYVHTVESGEPLLTETEFARDGLITTLSISAVRLLDGLVVTYTDITEARRQAILVAEGERLSVTGRFARMVGHEVRNPLTNIQLALDQLGSEGTQLPEQQLYFDILRRNSQRIDQLITEMLHTSRPLEVKMVPGLVNNVIADAFTQVKDRCELRKVKCVMELDPHLPHTPIDQSTLTVAFINLFVNAVEAMEEGKGLLGICTEHVKERVQVTVSDNGKGMSTADRERIFQPFFSGRSGGMGLGLTEARNIFNAHGALLTVESELGKGTTFRLLFPA